LIALREGFQLNDKIQPDKWISTLWHGFGWLIRFFLFGVLYRLDANTFTLIAYIIIAWPVYNIACNIGLKQKWYYVGSTSFIDKALKALKIRWIWFVRSLK